MRERKTSSPLYFYKSPQTDTFLSDAQRKGSVAFEDQFEEGQIIGEVSKVQN
jgi:hypothetical protein